jgi:glycosyltransferase involved in cell wall biosynthesis
LKIIHCLNHFMPQNVAGTEIYTKSLVQELLLKHIEAVVLIPNYGKTISNTYQYEDMRVIQFAEPSIVDKALIMGKIIPEGLKYFKQIIENEKPSLVHFHVVGGSNGITLRHVQAVKQMGIKIVMTFHLAGYTCKTGNLMYKNKELCNGVIDAMRCTRCIYIDKKMGAIKKNILYGAAVTSHALHHDATVWNNRLGTAVGTPFLVDQLKKNLLLLSGVCDKMVVLTNWYKKVLEINGVPSEKLVHIGQGLPKQQAFEKNILKRDILKLVFVGRIHESKGLHLLIEALKQLSKEKIMLDIYGQINNDIYSNECMAVISTMKNVNWKGLLVPEMVVKTLSHYDCLCVPSVICEMSPLVIQEAFAAGIPVLGSDVYGNAEQIKNEENGWLFKYNDSEDLKNKMQMLIDDPEMIQDARTQIRLVKPFSKVADEYENLYREIVAS